ncbi:porin [Paraburkholderia sp.]|uniref:porin n=1 Tax=Paraburkholderia sp. TaxID=1926495 RepID=UPI0039E28576
MEIKKLVVLVGLTIPVMASAQSSVTLYGVVDTSLEMANTGANQVVRMASGKVVSSRFGMQGQEDIGGGTRVIFRLENGFNSATGALASSSVLFNRESWVGLQSNYGTVKFGVQYTPFHTARVKFGATVLGDGMSWGVAMTDFTFGPTVRPNNSVRYESPVIAGFTLRAMYARGTNGTTGQPGSLGDIRSAGLEYANGALLFEAAWLDQVGTTANPITSSSPTARGNFSLFTLGYDFGFMRPRAVFQMHRGGPNVSTSYAAGAVTPKHNIYELDDTIPVGRDMVTLSVGHYAKLGDSSGDATGYHIRYDHPLSKATVLYAGAGYVRNGSSASFTVGDASAAGVAVKAGENATSVAVGLVHSF